MFAIVSDEAGKDETGRNHSRETSGVGSSIILVFSFPDLPVVCGTPDKRQGLRVRPRAELPAPP